jgi:hypothetical protein
MKKKRRKTADAGKDVTPPPTHGSFEDWVREQLAGTRGFLPEADAPPVDLPLLRRFQSGQLSGQLERDVSTLVASYASWARAFFELARTPPATSGGPDQGGGSERP